MHHDIILFSSHCAQCNMVENLLLKKNLSYSVVDNKEDYMALAEKHNIRSMPFASVDGEIMNSKELVAFIKAQ